MRFSILSALAAVMLSSPAMATQPSLEDFYLRQRMPVQYTPPAVPEKAAPAQAETPVAGSHVVTSVSKCYEELGPDESAEIKRNSLTPYADCQKRLRERAIEKKAAKNAEPVAETPRNYKRVSDDEDALSRDADSPKSKGDAAKGQKKK